MKFDQIAMHDARGLPLKKLFLELGAESWADDTVTSIGVICDPHSGEYVQIENIAQLSFNYDIFPAEFELIHYLEGYNFLRFINYGALSHFGTHVVDIDHWREYMKIRDFKLVQEVVTQQHTSEKVDKHYHYAIYYHQNVRAHWKLIQRVYADVEGETNQLLERYK